MTPTNITQAITNGHNISGIVEKETPRTSWLKLNASWIKSEVNYKFR